MILTVGDTRTRTRPELELDRPSSIYPTLPSTLAGQASCNQLHARLHDKQKRFTIIILFSSLPRVRPSLAEKMRGADATWTVRRYNRTGGVRAVWIPVTLM